MDGTERKIREMMAESRRAAMDALCRYKFERFGYHAARWVSLNKALPKPEPNPFRDIVKSARASTGFTPARRRQAPPKEGQEAGATQQKHGD